MLQLLWKTAWRLLKKMKERPTVDGIQQYKKKIEIRIMKKYLYYYVPCSITHNSQDVKTR
jgi:hypothetical protein